MADLDEMLRERLRGMADVPVRSADEVEKDVLERLARRRRRRYARSGVAVLAVALLGGALVTVRASDDADVMVGEPGPGQDDSRANPLLSIAVERDVDGGEDIVFTFVEPLPRDRLRPISGVDALDMGHGGIQYTTQDVEGAIHVCESRHFGFEPIPPPTGSVDVFIPAAWMAPAFNPNEVPIDMDVRAEDAPEADGTPGKIVGCGPYSGYIQYSIWAPASDDLDDVSAYVTSSNRLVVEIRP